MRLWGRSDRLKLGTTTTGLLRRNLTLEPRAAQTHLHVIGVSGSGKSRFLASFFLELLSHGLSAILLDPHGDLAHLVLSHLVARGYFDDESAYGRLLYLDIPAAERRRRFLPMNVLAQPYDDHTTARCVLEALRRAWPSLDGGAAPNFENVVLAGTFVLIRHRLPLALLHDLLVNRAWRDRLLAGVDDDQVVGFFRERYDRWGREQPTLIESTLRRIFLLAFSPVLRYSLAQAECLNFRDMFDQGRSLIVNLALGDADARRLLGCLLTVAAEQAALSRAELPPHQRQGSTHLILDEFAEFTAQSEESLSRILSLCRKYGLFLVMAHQTWSQASDRLRGAMQNVGVEVAFRLGRADAEHSVAILGRVNPQAVKHEVADPHAQERTHPAFYSLAEQWEAWVAAIQDLPPRQAFIRHPGGAVHRITTLNVPDAAVAPERVQAVEEQYLARCFRAQEAIERQLAAARPGRPTLRQIEPLP